MTTGSILYMDSTEIRADVAYFLGEVHTLHVSAYGSALWQPYSDCGLQVSAGFRDGARFMCTSIR